MPGPFAIVAAVISVVAGGLAYVQAAKAAKDAKRAQESLSGVLVNKNSNIEPIPVIYGKRRVGGTRVFVSTQDAANGDPNEFLYICLVLCEGEVESIESIEIDETPITDDRFNYTDAVTINKHYGTDSQTVDTLLQEANSDWTSNHRLRGVAYLAVRLKYNSDAFSGIPNITALVEGKKVYDPRTSTTGYSTNPALCIRDYLTNARYGKGLSTDVIDDDAFETAANDCDASVTYWSGGDSGKIFECNMVLDTGDTVFNNLTKMLLGCRGFLPYRQGEYALLIDKSASSAFAFTEDHIIDGVQIKGERKQDKANRYVVTFVNPDANWQEDTAVWPDPGSSEEADLLAEDNGTLLQKEITLETITNFYAARDFARIFVKRSRNALRATFRATSEALQLTAGDVGTVTLSTPGWSAKPFQIERIGLGDDGTCSVEVLEYDSTIYTYDQASEQQAYPDTNLPNPFSVEVPSALVVTETANLGPDGGLEAIIQVSWTAPDDGFVTQYEVQYKPQSESDYYSIFTTETQVESVGAFVNVAYDVRVRAINSLGVRSAWVSTTYTPGGTYSVVLSAGISAPTTAKAWLDADLSKVRVNARVEVTVDFGAGAVPDLMVIAYGWGESPNQLAISTDNGSSKLYLDESNANTGVAGSFSLTAAAGSTTSVINHTGAGAIDIDLSGNWWVSVDDGVTATRYHKVHEVTSTTIRLPPGETLSQTPGAGDTINILELEWNDPRPAEFKLVYVNGEIIKHNGINFDGNYYLEAVTRGAEGTTQASQSAQIANYLPALGPGSFQIAVDLAEFEQVGSLWSYTDTVELDVPAEFGWGAMSCFFAKKVSNSENVDYVRGQIKPFTYAGTV